MSDSLIFDLPLEAFSFLIEEAKSTAFMVLKQMPNTKAEQHSITHRRRMAQQSWTVAKGIQYPNYGRRGK